VCALQNDRSGNYSPVASKRFSERNLDLEANGQENARFLKITVARTNSLQSRSRMLPQISVVVFHGSMRVVSIDSAALRRGLQTRG
jgi:hypothetical protein